MQPLKRSLLGGASALALLAGTAATGAPFDFSFTGAIQNGTISQSGMYLLSMGGAPGGSSTSDGLVDGGIGASVSGTLYLSAGSIFSVLVGGTGYSGLYSGGGGGMSWFDIGNNGSIEAVAGGGGGSSLYATGLDGLAGTAGGSPAFGGSGGTAGDGGGAVFGAGGAGLFGAGASSYEFPAYGGQSASGAWVGGSSPGFGTGAGGFGGGGGSYFNGGGGGGFSGGGGGINAGPGGGGGSYLSSLFADQTLTTGGATSGSFFSLDLVPTAPVPTPAAFGLMASSLLALGAVARRRRKDD